MASPRTYVLGGGLAFLSVAAMAWTTFPPDDGPDQRLATWVAVEWQGFSDWMQSGPLSPIWLAGPFEDHDDALGPDAEWRAAALQIHDGDPERGARAIQNYGCGACHEIPGIAGARGSVGPSLAALRRQAYVAGVLPNEPGGLVRWIVEPTAHSPQTAMPDLGVSEGEARDIAAYLYEMAGR